MKKAKDQLGTASSKREQQQKAYLLKIEANKKLDLFQRYIGIALIASAVFGIYLLATDKSLWLLAVSHAYGLIAISAIDIVLGATNLLSLTRKIILPTYGWAALTILLQLGDLVTAPQYNMTIQYFATYLFSLWAFDGILVMQVAIMVVGLSARRYQKILVRKKQLTYFDMGFKKSRRDFLQISGAIGILIGLGGVLAASEAFSNGRQSNNTNTATQTSSLPGGAIANINDLQVDSPITFNYPNSSSPNVLVKKSDGSLVALSLLCTHICCELNYSSSDIYCPCHGSIFDPTNGSVIRGPAAVALPSIKLNVDSSGNIFPVSVNGSSPCISG
jgi:arsenite oxidase small subunit